MNHPHPRENLSGATIAKERLTSAPAAVDREDVGISPASRPRGSEVAANETDGGEDRTVEIRLLAFAKIFWSYRKTIATWTAIGLLLGWLSALAMGPSYTAIAVVQTSLVSEAPAKGIQAPTLDANFLLESEIQLMMLQPLPRELTVKFNQDFPMGRSRSMVSAEGDRSILTLLSSAASKVARFLYTSDSAQRDRNDLTSIEDITLEIGYRRRTYLIEVSTRASNPERAAAYTNAVASQYVRLYELKRRKAREISARQELSELMLSYGERHPLVVRAQSDIRSLQRDFDMLMTTPTVLNENEIVGGGGSAVPARASLLHANSSYKSLAGWALIGLFCSLGFVIYKERRRLPT